jgi:hypothetical protein
MAQGPDVITCGIEALIPIASSVVPAQREVHLQFPSAAPQKKKYPIHWGSSAGLITTRIPGRRPVGTLDHLVTWPTLMQTVSALHLCPV